MSHLLFSYGTLQLPSVQNATFGRRMPVRRAELVGYVLDSVAITDTHVLEVSGSAVHPFARRTGDTADRVPGVVLELSDDELAAADEYEVDDYTRVAVQLASGETAWLYVDAASVAD
ncbi:gamma-glutamylcyclotransferase family protein [Humibacter albus]|uniref:gamma-glutamylcyclotransferase family protein n=1 Tax=Humibacter albus TaxID=427754 RepID=UPI00040B9C69|nr:gamma-glutamylcyclotransferase family protein [Humibacter albus]